MMFAAPTVVTVSTRLQDGPVAADIVLLRDKDWSVIDGELCRVKQSEWKPDVML